MFIIQMKGVAAECVFLFINSFNFRVNADVIVDMNYYEHRRTLNACKIELEAQRNQLIAYSTFFFSSIFLLKYCAVLLQTI